MHRAVGCLHWVRARWSSALGACASVDLRDGGHSGCMAVDWAVERACGHCQDVRAASTSRAHWGTYTYTFIWAGRACGTWRLGRRENGCQTSALGACASVDCAIVGMEAAAVYEAVGCACRRAGCVRMGSCAGVRVRQVCELGAARMVELHWATF